MELKQRIQELSATIAADVIDYRRYLHTHPELSFEEYNTCDYVSGLLTEFGIRHEKGVAGGN